jgi:hypothetical protein
MSRLPPLRIGCAVRRWHVMMAMLIGAFRFELPEGVEPAFKD